jgi:hypothetical protein
MHRGPIDSVVKTYKFVADEGGGDMIVRKCDQTCGLRSEIHAKAVCREAGRN